MSIISIFGGGMPGMGPGPDEEPVKQFSVDECLDEIINYFKENPGYVHNNCTVHKLDEAFFMGTLYPSVTERGDWDRIQTIRPNLEQALKVREELEEAGFKRPPEAIGSGTDMVIREFENVLWDDYDKILKVKVVTEFGHIIGMLIELRWD